MDFLKHERLTVKRIVPDIVEKARFDNGMGIYRGEFYGAFMFQCKGVPMLVVAAKGEPGIWPFPGEPWDHVSVSVQNGERCPTWEEMCWVKSLFFDDDECVVQYHPPKSDYVNVHPFVLHLWRPTESVIPMPPKGCV